MNNYFFMEVRATQPIAKQESIRSRKTSFDELYEQIEQKKVEQAFERSRSRDSSSEQSKEAAAKLTQELAAFLKADEKIKTKIQDLLSADGKRSERSNSCVSEISASPLLESQEEEDEDFCGIPRESFIALGKALLENNGDSDSEN